MTLRTVKKMLHLLRLHDLHGYYLVVLLRKNLQINKLSSRYRAGQSLHVAGFGAVDCPPVEVKPAPKPGLKSKLR